ncbi:Na(+)/H(+) antiporter subunit F1 [Bacillus benzoevorans]|uniref:Multicomponent Na+:H+ antiporter subunit F n=1 Tax=Bacillus benzoevorans TaxID=1456 RepID=A0A7X0LVU1_9BACI|nr:Na(+)/H(+) antiporter subunit F1 [Bacillus benzoevorans]MBB6444644.1 multicomponent Na+:H+ antiporter subunit F [Bacillus benzoevorans]
MFNTILITALFFITLSILVIIYRLIKGPSVPDRVQALDFIGIHLIAGVAIVSIYLRTHAFLDIILLLGILSFVGTIAFARFIESGVVIERKRIK